MKYLFFKISDCTTQFNEYENRI